MLRIIAFFLFIGNVSAQFSGKYLILSDADMAATAYIDGELKQIKGQRDSLSLLSIHADKVVHRNSIAVSNSVTNWVKSAAISADNKTAFVIQTRGEVSDSIKKVENVSSDFPEGNTIVSVDISNWHEPKVLDTLRVGAYPTSIELSPDGQFLAVTVQEKHSEILLIALKGNKFLGVFRHPHAVYSKEGNIRATDISWHPSGRYLAVTLEEDRTLAFYKLIETNYGTKLALLGAPVEIGDLTGKSEFTPDGKFCLVTNLRDWIQPSEIISIQFDEGGNHHIKSRIDVGRAAENFTIHPDGNQVAVLNMEGSHFSENVKEYHTDYSSISLLSLTEEGQLKLSDHKTFVGILPEGIIYNRTGNGLTTAIYEIPATQKGALEFWKISDENKLNRTNVTIQTPRGTHFVIEIKE